MTTNSYVSARLRFQPGTPTSVRTALLGVQDALDKTAGITMPSVTDRVALWVTVQDWANQNLAEIQGSGSATAQAGGATKQG